MANPITVTLAVSPDVILRTGEYGAGAKVHIQSASTAAGPFADLTGTGSTPTILITSGVWSYSGDDPAGTSSTYYRWRVEDTTGAARISDWSEVFQATTSNSSAIGGYATRDGVKLRLGRATDGTDTRDDELIQKYCNQVNQQMETRLGYPIWPVPSAVYLFDGKDAVDSRASRYWSRNDLLRRSTGQTMLLPMGVRTISLLRIADQTNGTFSTVASTDYVIQPPVQQRIPQGAPGDRVTLVDNPVGGTVTQFYYGFRNVEITMTAGWDVTPDDLIDCGETTVVRAFQARRTGQNDTTGNDDMGRAIISRILAAEWRDVLASYRMVAPRIG